MHTLATIEVFVLSYLIGSIPIGYIIAHVFLKTNIQSVGSGNIGATNMYRIGGWKYSLPVFLLDVLKGALPVLITLSMLPEYAPLAAVSVICGNIFPLWLKFKGGKGIATGTGALGVLFPIGVISAMVLFAIIIKTTKIASLASLISTCSILIYVLISSQSPASITATVVILLLILFAHRSNINRLVNNKEKTIQKISK